LGYPAGGDISILPNISTTFGLNAAHHYGMELLRDNAVCDEEEMVNERVAKRKALLLSKAKFGEGELSPSDMEKLALTKQIRALMGHGSSWEEIAAAVGKSRDAVINFARRATFRRCCEYLDIEEKAAAPPRMDLKKAKKEFGKESQGPDPEDMVQMARQAFAELAPDTIEFYQDCYRRNPPELWPTLGKWHDPALAQWAAERVSKGLGLLEPEHVARPIITIHLGAIHGVLAQVTTEDQQVRRAIDVSPSPEG